MKTYFISDGTYVKIGKSVDPSKRLAQLQTASPATLYLVAVINGDHEETCHRLFAKFRRNGEWFELEASHLQLLAALTSKPRCVGISEAGRCRRSAQALGFCKICPVGPHLYLSTESCLRLADADWEALDEAAAILRLRPITRQQVAE